MSPLPWDGGGPVTSSPDQGMARRRIRFVAAAAVAGVLIAAVADAPSAGTGVPSAGAAIPSAAPGAPSAAAGQPGSAPGAGPAVTWDFETGDLRGWRVSGAAFAGQPTREDRSGATFGHQGEYWVSSYPPLPRDAARPAPSLVGDAAQGALESLAFDIPPGRLSFLIGGASAFATRLELVAIDADGRETRVLHATGSGSDAMQRVTWDLTPFAGRRGRIRIVDASTRTGGRIHVDDIRFASAEVPNLIGRDEAEARRVLEARGLRVGTAARVESRVAAGRVLAQAPRAGARVEPGAAVDIDVAAPAQVAMPNLVGHDEQAAIRRLAAAELTLGRVRRRESDQPEGTVVSQSPAANRRARIGTAVDLVVAAPRIARVPDLLGHDAANAERLLSAADLRRGRVRRQESRQRSGTVLSQAPPAQTQVAPGTAVDFVVAAPVLVRVPNLLGRGAGAADARLGRAELRRGQTSTEESREPEGTVIRQAPGAGGRAPAGSAVDLVVAVPVTVLVPDLLGLDETAVATLLAGRELDAGIVERQRSDRTPGTVLAQEPAAGTRVVLGTAVAFVLAIPPPVVLPDLAGLPEAEALDALAGADLAAGALEYRESAAEAGLVLEQWPAAGQTVDVGSAVDLVIAAVETVEIPNLVGLPVDGARQVLDALRLTVGSETRRPSRTDAEGTVIDQDPPAAVRFAVGSPVDLVVAEPALVRVPEIVGLAIDDVDGALAGAGLAAGPIEPRFSLAQGGAVLAQAPPAGAVVPVGTTVAVGVARDRMTWAGPLAAGLLLVALLAGRARRRRRRRTVPPAPAPTPRAPSAPAGSLLTAGSATAAGPAVVTGPAAGAGPAGATGPAAATWPAGATGPTAAPAPAEAATGPTAAPGGATEPAAVTGHAAATGANMTEPGVSVRAMPDAGTQRVAPGAPPASGAVVRCRLRIDGGTQRIAVGGTADNWGRLVTGERRQT